MNCAFCGSNESNVKTKLANAEGGLVRLPVCPVDATLVDETFSAPLSFKRLVGMQA